MTAPVFQGNMVCLIMCAFFFFLTFHYAVKLFIDKAITLQYCWNERMCNPFSHRLLKKNNPVVWPVVPSRAGSYQELLSLQLERF